MKPDDLDGIYDDYAEEACEIIDEEIKTKFTNGKLEFIIYHHSSPLKDIHQRKEIIDKIIEHYNNDGWKCYKFVASSKNYGLYVGYSYLGIEK